MADVDTSREAVVRLTWDLGQRIEFINEGHGTVGEYLDPLFGEVAATLRALLARAEAVEAELAENEGVIAVWRGRTQRAEAERNRLREALLTAQAMLSEMSIASAEKCQMAYDYLHEARAALGEDHA